MHTNKKLTGKQEAYYQKIKEVEVLMFGLDGKEYIKFHPNMARILGGFREAIFLQQLFFWKDKGDDPDGWIYKTKNELEEETAIPRSTQDRVRNKLVKMGLIEVKNKCRKRSSTPVLHYRIDTEGVLAMTQNELSAMTQSGSLHKPKVSCSNDPKLTNHIGTEDNTEDNTEEEENPPKKVKRGRYGKQENVRLTEEEFEGLGRKLTNKFRDELIEEMSSYMVINRKSYGDYNLAIQAWSRKEFKKDRLVRAMEELERQNPRQRQEETLTAEEKKLKAECEYCYHGQKAGVTIDHDCHRVRTTALPLSGN